MRNDFKNYAIRRYTKIDILYYFYKHNIIFYRFILYLLHYSYTSVEIIIFIILFCKPIDDFLLLFFILGMYNIKLDIDGEVYYNNLHNIILLCIIYMYIYIIRRV